jgi:hypothetical protein
VTGITITRDPWQRESAVENQAAAVVWGDLEPNLLADLHRRAHLSPPGTIRRCWATGYQFAMSPNL